MTTSFQIHHRFVGFMLYFLNLQVDMNEMASTFLTEILWAVKNTTGSEGPGPDLRHSKQTGLLSSRTPLAPIFKERLPDFALIHTSIKFNPHNL